MTRKVGLVIRVGAPGYRAAQGLFRRVVADGWAAIGVDPDHAPKRITLGAVTAEVLAQVARGVIRKPALGVP